MLGNIIDIKDRLVIVELEIDIYKQSNLLGVHVIFEDNSSKILGEILSLNTEFMEIYILGYIEGTKFIDDVKIPSFASKVRVVTLNELETFLGPKVLIRNSLYLGNSNIYKNYKVSTEINSFFTNNFMILGQKNSGKTLMLENIVSNIFSSSQYVPLNAKIFLVSNNKFNDSFDNFTDISFALNYRNIRYDSFKIPFSLFNEKEIMKILNIDSKYSYLLNSALKLSMDDNLIKNNTLANIIRRIINLNISDEAKKYKIIYLLENINSKLLNLDLFIKKGIENITLNNLIKEDVNSPLIIEYLGAFKRNDSLKNIAKYKEFINNLKILFEIDEEINIFNKLNLNKFSNYFSDDEKDINNFVEELFKFDKKYQVVNINVNNEFEEKLSVILLDKIIDNNVDEIYHIFIDDLDNYQYLERLVNKKINLGNGIYYGFTIKDRAKLNANIINNISNYIVMDDNVKVGNDYIDNKIKNKGDYNVLAFGTSFKVPVIFGKNKEFKVNKLDRYWYR